ncbi:leucine-rich melanocyte differentiation-associated protein-like [Symsagittifera roscoffensis]|uniref:leucine-rich melanocyte differentiation-associated protein-like n=1 Tax=Symsagittifera roscoffensis TaxID=84072 RepID=UPI00307B1645
MPRIIKKLARGLSKVRHRKMSKQSDEILLTNKNLTSFPSNSNYSRLSRFCVLLDLSQNQIKHLDFLCGFSVLRTLILDDNLVGSVFKCTQQTDSLQNLSINRNQITNLPVFLNNLKSFFPNLLWLSMMNNEAAPSYFNGGSKFEHNDYRMFVSFKLPELLFLDCEKISDEERQQGVNRYSPRPRHTTMHENLAYDS